MKNILTEKPNWILGALLLNHNTSQEIILELAYHGDPVIRRYAAQHEDCPIEAQVSEVLQRKTL
jgi:hypothetical protein